MSLWEQWHHHQEHFMQSKLKVSCFIHWQNRRTSHQHLNKQVMNIMSSNSRNLVHSCLLKLSGYLYNSETESYPIMSLSSCLCSNRRSLEDEGETCSWLTLTWISENLQRSRGLWDKKSVTSSCGSEDVNFSLTVWFSE